MVEVMTSRNSNKSYNSGTKGTKTSNTVRRTLRKALDSVLAAPALQVGQTAPFIPNQVHPLMAAPYAGSKTDIHDLHASMLTAEKAVQPARKLGNTWPSILADRLSEKSLPEALCSRVTP